MTALYHILDEICYSSVVIRCGVMGEVNPSPAVQQCPKIIWSCFTCLHFVHIIYAGMPHRPKFHDLKKQDQDTRMVLILQQM